MPITRLRGGTCIPSGTSAPAATIDSSPSDGAVQDDRADPHEAEPLDRAAVERHRVADRHVLGQHGRVLGGHVEHAVVLDVGPGAHADPVHVAADHGVHPDARVLPELDRADHLGGRVHVGASAQSGPYPLVGADHPFTLKTGSLSEASSGVAGGAPRKNCSRPATA